MKRRNKNKLIFNRKMKKKVSGIFLFVVLAFIALVGRITYINAKSGDEYKKKVLEQQDYTSRTIPFKRGNIQDCNGTILASSNRVYNVIVDAKELNNAKKKKAKTEKVLKDIFDIKKKTIENVLEETPNSRYRIVKKTVPYQTAKDFLDILEDDEKSSEIVGVWLEEGYKRVYPYATLGSGLLGFTSDGNIGSYGIEQAYNDTLNGTNGREYGFQSNELSLERDIIEATDGENVVSTIDLELQKILENHIYTYNQKHRNQSRTGESANHIGVVMMNPNNGEILAMESYPNFDLNDPSDLSLYFDENQIEAMKDEEYQEKIQTMWKNFCLTDAFEPGSTQKPFTVATGLENSALKGDETYVCGGSLLIGDDEIHCHATGGHGEEDLSAAIADSCNVALMHIGAAIGPQEFSRYQNIFGFGTKTGVDIPGEGLGTLYNPADMMEVDLATNSFGQNFTCTEIQMASAYCSLINGGTYYKPHIVKKITNSKGETVKDIKAECLRKTVSEKTSETLRRYMEKTVTEGTGKRAAVSGYDIGGKTGTAETLPRNNGEYIISFAGFAPIENPQVMLYVVIDRPNADSQEDTSLVTGLAHDIMMDAFKYLGIKTNGEDVEANEYCLPLIDNPTISSKSIKKVKLKGVKKQKRAKKTNKVENNNANNNQENQQEQNQDQTPQVEQSQEETQMNSQENTQQGIQNNIQQNSQLDNTQTTSETSGN